MGISSGYKAASMFLVACSLICAVDAAPIGGYRDIKMTPARDFQRESQGELRADADELADLLKIKTMVNDLRRAKASGIDSDHLPHSLQYARMRCLWKMFIAAQDVRTAVAAVNSDLSHSNRDLDEMTSKRDMAVNLINTFNFAQGGTLGVIKNATTFPGRYHADPATRQEEAMVSFGTSTGLAAIDLIVPGLCTKKIQSPPNILARIFNPDLSRDESRQSFLWQFINRPIPGTTDGLTRRQVLIKHWEALARLNVKDENRLRKLSESTSDGDLSENIQIVAQRMNLLYDLKSHVEEFDAALYELHNTISFE